MNFPATAICTCNHKTVHAEVDQLLIFSLKWIKLAVQLFKMGREINMKLTWTQATAAGNIFAFVQAQPTKQTARTIQSVGLYVDDMMWSACSPLFIKDGQKKGKGVGFSNKQKPCTILVSNKCWIKSILSKPKSRTPSYYIHTKLSRFCRTRMAVS